MKKLAGLLVLATAMVPMVSSAAGAGRIVHDPLACVPAQGNARVEATLAPGITASSVSVYFRAEGAKDEYYAVMRRNQPGRYWAVLPEAAPGLQAIQYRVVAHESGGEFVQSPTVRVPVVAGCPVSLLDDEKRYARNIVLGMTSADQGDAMVGFGCAGIVAKITSAGDLRTLGSCVDGTGVMASVAGSKGNSGGSAPKVGPGPATSSTTAAPARSNAGGLVIGGTNSIGVTAGVLNDVPISTCRPR